MNLPNSPHLRPTRRTFLKSSAVAAAAFTLPCFSIGQSGVSPNSKINVACVGIGNRGFFAVSELMKDPRVNLVAFCDVDQTLVAETHKKGAELKKTAELTCADLTTVPVFKDYREMLAAHDWLKKTSESVISLYAAETKLKKEDLAEMMDATTFFTAEETLKAGFATHVESTAAKEKDTSLYKGVDPRPQNYLKYINSPTYKSVSYERPKDNHTPPPGEASPQRRAAKALSESLSLLLQ
jgi:hypothetical protein